PKSRSGYDAITVFVDRLTKMVHLAPSHANDNAKDVADCLVNKVIALHGVPQSIVSDRDSKFTSLFWKSLMQRLNIQSKMSSAFHPQTDGQTERMNRTLEQILRMYVEYNQKNWESLLPLAEFAINNHVSASTGYSPFYLNYGLHPPMTTYSPRGVA